MVGQTKQALEGEASLDHHIRVKPWLASALRAWRRPALGDALLVEPDRQVASIDQRPVVVRPVCHPVTVFRLRRAVVDLRFCRHESSLASSETRYTAGIDIILRQRLQLQYF